MKKHLIFFLTFLSVLLFSLPALAKPRLIATSSYDLYPSVYGNKIVYSGFFGGDRIFVRDLKASSASKIFSTSGVDQRHFFNRPIADVYKNRVVWVSQSFQSWNGEKPRKRLQPKIVVSDLGSSKTQTLPVYLNPESLILSPSLSKKKMAYISYGSVNSELFLYDLAAKRKWRIDKDVSLSCDLSDSALAWVKNVSGAKYFLIKIRSFKSGKTAQMKIGLKQGTFSSQCPGEIALSGDNLIYSIMGNYGHGDLNSSELWRINLKTKVRSLVDKRMPFVRITPNSVSGRIIETVYSFDLSREKLVYALDYPGQYTGGSWILLDTIDVTPPRIEAVSVSASSFPPHCLEFILKSNEKASGLLRIFDRRGNQVKVLSDLLNPFDRGEEEFYFFWNGYNRYGRPCATGTYSYSVTATDKWGNRSQCLTGCFTLVRDENEYPMECKSNMKTLGTAEEAHYTDHNTYTNILSKLSEYVLGGFWEKSHCPKGGGLYKVAPITDFKSDYRISCSTPGHKWVVETGATLKQR